MLEYRAEFDAEVALDGGGELRARGFRLVIPHADVTEAEIADLLAASLAPQRVRRAEVSEVRIFAEPRPPAGESPAERVRFVDLSHSGPGDGPAPAITTEAGAPVNRFAELPTVVVRAVGSHRGIAPETLAHVLVAGHAVLLHTGGGAYLTRGAAALLADRGAALVGIDGVSIDDASPASDGERPAHTLLLAAGIPIVEHLTNLRELPPIGARFTAVPPRLSGFGTFPVHAYATVPAEEVF